MGNQGCHGLVILEVTRAGRSRVESRLYRLWLDIVSDTSEGVLRMGDFLGGLLRVYILSFRRSWQRPSEVPDFLK